MIKIALSGTARAGKDTFANILEKELESQGYSVVKLAFAAHLKRLYEQLFQPEDLSIKPRDAYITLGNAFREIDSNYWIDAVEVSLRSLEAIDEANPDSNLAVIITDTRYFNESLWASQEGFIVVKVDADPLIRQARAEALGETLKLDNEGDMEVDLIQANITVYNNGDSDFIALPSIAKAVIEEYKAYTKG